VEDFRSSFAGTLFRVDKIHARMRDGTIIAREENDPPLTVDLGETLQKHDSVRVQLSVPKLRPRDSNASSAAGDKVARYLFTSRNLFDENQSGGNERTIEVRDLNACLLLAPDEGYEQLPIAQVKRSVGEEAAPQLDETYIPPTLSTHGWVQLGQGLIRGVHDALIQNVNELTDMLRDVNLKDQILEVSQSGRFALLDRLNEVSAALGIMIPARGVHPFTSYVELCRLVGKLAIFTNEKRAPQLPRYDHDDLGGIFREVAALIRIMLESIQFKNYRQKSFTWEGKIMQAELAPAWFDPSENWYIGVERPEQVSDAECRRLLSSKENNFLWKFGSKDQDIYELFARGLELEAIEHGRQERVLPPQQYWSYWRVSKDKGDPVYSAVSKSHMVAVYMKDNNQHSFDPSQYAGTSRFPVKGGNDQVFEFKLALFGVRK
jgi:type VI secretion system protein ImpJ